MWDVPAFIEQVKKDIEKAKNRKERRAKEKIGALNTRKMIEKLLTKNTEELDFNPFDPY